MNRNHLAGECTLESADGAPELPIHKLRRAMNKKQERTGQYSLTLALDCILRGSIATKSKLRNLYDLDPKTILKIEAGRKLSPSTHKHYLETFVGIINNHRCLHQENEPEMNEVLADILLVECGLKTNSEKLADFEDEKRAEFVKSICSGKI